MSDQIKIIEMGPRDGLQNEKTPVSVEARIAFVEALVAAGLNTVEVGAFVSPKAIPQMASSEQVLRGVSHIKGAEFHVLVPNEKGYDAARAAGAQVVSVFAAASEGFSRANINCSVAEIDRALQAGAGPRQGRRRQGARLYLLRARLSVRRRDQAEGGRRPRGDAVGSRLL
ncbi:isopropylmalate/homocitrate/citramalate synthase [Bradyrhizobium elkanii]